MAGDDEQQAYLDEMAASRGYVLDYHRALVRHDLPVMRAFNDLLDATYLAERSLDRRTQELLFVATLTVMRAPREQIAAHMRTALAHGATARELLEALELLLPEAGVVIFQEGFEVWREVVAADGLDAGATGGDAGVGGGT